MHTAYYQSSPGRRAKVPPRISPGLSGFPDGHTRLLDCLQLGGNGTILLAQLETLLLAYYWPRDKLIVAAPLSVLRPQKLYC